MTGLRRIIPFNHDWLFRPSMADDTVPDTDFQAVTIPHTNQVVPHQGFDDAAYQFISTYRKRFTLPEPLDGRRLYLDFEGAMLAATVTLNGNTFPEHRGGYTPFSFDITDLIDETGENVLTVHLDSTERADIPPFGFVVDYLTFGGIYREVSLRYVAPVHILDVFVRTYDVLTDNPRLEVDAWIKNQTKEAAQVTVFVDTAPVTEGAVDEVRAGISVPAGEVIKHTTHMTASVFQRWTLENPALETAVIGIQSENSTLDEVEVRYGFREAEFKDDGFYLNGEKVFLRGLNRHQTYPYIGAAAPARLQRKDADIVRYELGCNIVRTSHYPQSKHFLNRCDEIGLLVFEEIPGWQHIGDDDWQALSLRDVRVMIERDRNHPSIILWGVRINESFDSTAFYTRTNALAHELDPTRQTGGVRFFQGSEFLEDVYTINDFSNDVMEPSETPYLITEFNGHMFPTKSFDNDERRIEHAIRHLRIQDRALAMGGVSGAIGWCAFDYNTHKEFGSGDRMCHHGVMDIFRLPKYAAHAYASQVPPSERVVLQAASVWSMGDRSEGGNDPLYIFSNCDTVRVIVGDDEIGVFEPEREAFPYLPHPPFKVTGLTIRWGDAFGDLYITGYIDDRPVAEQTIHADGQPHHIDLRTDDDQLIADSIDMTRIVVRLVDAHDNPLPYLAKIVTFSLDGPGELIGTNPFPLIGGGAAIYLKATDESGTATVTACIDGLPDATTKVTFTEETTLKG